jgi:hypothetical protein
LPLLPAAPDRLREFLSRATKACMNDNAGAPLRAVCLGSAGAPPERH